MIRPGEELTSEEIGRRAACGEPMCEKGGVMGVPEAGRDERQEADVEADGSGDREAGSEQSEKEDGTYDPHLKTSYFAGRSWQGTGKGVSISRGKPKWYDGRTYDALAPPWNLVHEHDEETFRRKYKRQVLDKLDPVQVVYELGDGAVMLCWEAPGEFCHRRVVAEWLEEELGITVPELGAELLPKKPTVLTLDSFV